MIKLSPEIIDVTTGSNRSQIGELVESHDGNSTILLVLWEQGGAFEVVVNVIDASSRLIYNEITVNQSWNLASRINCLELGSASSVERERRGEECIRIAETVQDVSDDEAAESAGGSHVPDGRGGAFQNGNELC